MMELLYSIFVAPFADMASDPSFVTQVLWDGFVQGTLYALIALGFVLIFKASGVFNFAQGILVVFSVLILVGLFEAGVPAWLALVLTIGALWLMAVGIERIVLRPLVNQHDAILLMATIGLARFLTGAGQFIFGGENKAMITEELGLPIGTTEADLFGGVVFFEHLDIAAVVIAATMVGLLAWFFRTTRVGRALRAVADDHQAALSVGISLNQIWAIVWFAAGIVALVTGIMWGARSDVSFALEIIALKALAVLIIGGFTSIPGAIIAGIAVGVIEKLFEIYWGPLMGGGVEAWFAYLLALVFLLFRPQGLFGEKIIERI
jgi:branched-chain amino acid transport system permease protein